MADFAPNYTARYRVRYSVQGNTHTMLWRVASDTESVVGIAAKVSLFLADLEGSLWSDWSVLGADFAPADSDIFLPTTAPDQPTGAGSTGSRANSDKAYACSFVGRSTGGNKARMFLYGTVFAASLRSGIEDDFRILSSENGDVSAAIVRLNETSPALVANDDNVATWYEYVNVKHNDRWVRRLRRG